MGIFNVHDLVTDIIGSLDKIHQRMTSIAQGFAIGRLAYNAEFTGYLDEGATFTVEETELPFLACCHGGERVFDDAGEGGISHDKSTGSATLKLMGEQTEGIGVALEVGDVAPELWRHLGIILIQSQGGRP